MPASRNATDSRARFSPLLFGLTMVALVWSAVLLFAGGFTTSIGAGMAFLDWPLSNGSLNPEGWTSDPDQLAEHSHRLAGMIIGILALALAVAYRRIDRRATVRRLAYGLLILVVIQGGLGGLRVLLDNLNTGAESNTVARSFAVAHAMGAQAVVLVLASLAVFSSPNWFRTDGLASGSGWRRWGVVSLGLLILAVLIGAIMRHNGAALAIQTFPAAAPDGSWIPQGDNFGVWTHFIHRSLGILGGLGVLGYAVAAQFRPDWNRNAKAFAALALFLTIVQIWLGLLILETLRNPHVATLHMLNGAALIASLWTSLCWAGRSLPATAGSETVSAPVDPHVA